ncbi:MAG TPA: hypothetical protein PLW09_16370 [Candidatus Kapabacteria bacterium]|nr:hypothetical protein [Candidatus Kapabacteria bacterium]
MKNNFFFLVVVFIVSGTGNVFSQEDDYASSVFSNTFIKNNTQSKVHLRRLVDIENLKKKANSYKTKLYKEHETLRSSAKQQSGSRREDSLALIDIFNEANGKNWNYPTNWLSNKPISEWEGVTTEFDFMDTQEERVVGLGLYVQLSNGNGVLSKSIGKLSKLRWFHSSGNRISGQIPDEITQLSELNDLTIVSNDITGSIPANIGNLKKTTGISSLFE